jgi:hypothetical protein
MTTTTKAQKVAEVQQKKESKIISTEDVSDDDDNVTPPATNFQRHNSLTRKQAAMIAASRAKALAQQSVSLSQLPPPIEADTDDELEYEKNTPIGK